MAIMTHAAPLSRLLCHGLLALLPWLFWCPAPAAAAPDDTGPEVQAILQMLDYVGVEYPEFVVDGRVLDEAEYAEQVEFAALIREKLATLPARPARQGLQSLAADLSRAISRRVAEARVSALTTELQQKVLIHYPVALTPARPPDTARAASLYQARCASCHGKTGRGDGPAATGMRPAPTDFHDRTRQERRTLLGLFNTITLGVDDTAMPGFADLDTDQRWALAFHVGQLAYSDAERETGANLWRDDPRFRRALPDLEALTRTSVADLRQRVGEGARPVSAYLRDHPSAVAAAGPAQHLTRTGELIRRSLDAYRRGDTERARRLGLSAYLDGFELAEPALGAVAPDLMREIETLMQDHRQLIAGAAPVARVAAGADRIGDALARAKERLAGDRMSPVASFAASFVILGREGLEAILVLAAVFAFLRRSGRQEALAYVHGGWILAVLAGIATWVLASRFIAISGASRETTEGVVALTAAGLLLYVGWWLHNRSYAQRWRRFISDRLESALARRSLWALTLLAFLTVYREIFETILFYQALWMQADHTALLAGLSAAAATLAAVTWAIFRFSARLPIGQFFTASALLIVVLAVVFTGKGVAALQEAGTLPVDPVDFIRLPLLGIHPNLEGLALQALVLAAVIAGFAYNHLTRSRAAA